VCKRGSDSCLLIEVDEIEACASPAGDAGSLPRRRCGCDDVREDVPRVNVQEVSRRIRRGENKESRASRRPFATALLTGRQLAVATGTHTLRFQQSTSFSQQCLFNQATSARESASQQRDLFVRF
jgi:hypothetical protein